MRCTPVTGGTLSDSVSATGMSSCLTVDVEMPQKIFIPAEDYFHHRSHLHHNSIFQVNTFLHIVFKPFFVHSVYEH